ncbi:hypothetical protein [Streptomyces sp. NPDC051211]|uniref:hypothetical protein n=1 Tax=Streptomyces sp. NPDC051211 TaxID=3154643 RepID=UPI00344DA284
MRTTRTLAAAALVAAALAGCSGSSDPKPGATTPTATQSTAPPTAQPTATGPAPGATAPSSSVAEQRARCVQAVVDQAATNPAELTADPRPPECSALSDEAYLAAYYEALAEVKKKGLDGLGGGSTGG